MGWRAMGWEVFLRIPRAVFWHTPSRLIVFTIIFWVCLGLTLVSKAVADPVYSFGMVPQFHPRQMAKIWLPLLEELERRTGLMFKMIGSPDIPTFEKGILSARFDIAYMYAYHTIKANDAHGYVPLVRDGGRLMIGILVVGKDSPVVNVAELAGRNVAFPSPNAFGASLLIRTELAAIPVVAISAAAMPSDIERAQNAGYKWYITKPINLLDILRVMREALAIEPEVSA